MKKIYLLSLSLFGMLFLACSTDNDILLEDQQIDDEKETITLGFEVGGELQLSAAPMMTRSADPNADLFGIQIYDSSGDPFAFVIGSNIHDVKVDLVKGETYDLEYTYIKRGQYLINYSSRDKTFSVPFNTDTEGIELNKTFYSSGDYLNYLHFSSISPVGYGAFENYIEVDRYHGFSESVEVNEDTEGLQLDLKRVVFGMDINFTLGEDVEQTNLVKLTFHPTGNHGAPKEFFIDLVDGKGSLHLPHLNFGSHNLDLKETFDGDFESEVHMSMGTENHSTLFYDGKFKVKRNTIYKLDFVARSYDASRSSFDFVFEEGPMVDADLIIE